MEKYVYTVDVSVQKKALIFESVLFGRLRGKCSITRCDYKNAVTAADHTDWKLH